jgi:OmpA-OmpF porin, OOP family
VRVFFCASMALGVSLGTVGARAQEPLPSVDVRTYRPSVDPRAQMFTEPVQTPHHLDFNLQGIVHYGHGPVLLSRADGSIAYRPVQNVLALDVGANVGLGGIASVGLTLPVILAQAGSDGLPATVSTKGQAPTTAVGDLGLLGKVMVVDNDTGGFGLAFLGGVTFPTGTPGSFARESSPTANLRGVVDYSLIIAGVQASAGYTLRTERNVWPDRSIGGITFGDSIPYSFGLWFKPAILKIDGENRQRWEIGLRGALPAGPAGPFGSGDPGSAQLSPLSLGASDRVELGKGRDVYLMGGAELGLTSAVGVPAFRVVLGIGYSFQRHDRDSDGVPDDKDECPDVAEDKDGHEDADGCPDIDDDEDGIVDKEDACPRQKGVKSSIRSQNGCPPKDSDGDGIPDDKDACPSEKGEGSLDAQCNGCRVNDRDADGVEDDKDACPDQAGPAEKNGCPVLDTDGDGLNDAEDQCPTQKGEAAFKGCPNPDRDGDTYANGVDQCPDEPETWNGIDDGDGCPDAGGKALVLARPDLTPPVFMLASKLQFEGDPDAPALKKESVVVLRALSTVLATHKEWTVAIGVRPDGTAQGGARALAKSFAIVQQISQFVPRDGAAETVSWDAVRNVKGADGGVGILVLRPGPAQPAQGAAHR